MVASLQIRTSKPVDVIKTPRRRSELTEMTNEFLALIAAYFVCADAAADRNLNSSEVLRCAPIYQDVKLEFLPGVELEDFENLSPAERSTVNRHAFLTYRKLRKSNPDLVQRLERAARGEGPLPKAG